MAYYVSPSGNDANSGRDPEHPFRSLTACLDMMAVELDWDVPWTETIHLAAGTYSRSSGERFPILIPSRIEVVGEGRDISIIDYGLFVPASCLPTGVCLYLEGALRDLKVTKPEDSFVTDIKANHENAVIERVSAGSTYFLWGALVSNLEIGEELHVLNGYRTGGDLYPLVEECTELGLGRIVSLGGGRIQNCDLRGSLGVRGDTIVENNRFENLWVFSVGSSLEDESTSDDMPIPQILNNQFGREDEGSGTPAPDLRVSVYGNSLWRGNSIWAWSFDVAADSSFEDNPQIFAYQICIGYGELIRNNWRQVNIRPRFIGNTFNQIRRSWIWEGDGAFPQAYIVVGADSRPVFEGNAFHSTRWRNIVWILDEAVPDFGGGGQSAGLNEFHRSWDFDIVIDIGDDNTLMLYAESNRWVRPGPVISKNSGSVDTAWSVAGSTLL